MTLMIRRFRGSAILSTLASVMALLPFSLAAQNTSLSPSLSSPIVQSTSTSGFNATFDAESSNLTNPELHSDISDPTHSQLLGSALTPARIPSVNGYVDSAPRTGTLYDAQQAVQYGEGALTGHLETPFASRSMTAGFGNLSSASAFRGSFAAGTPQSALAGLNSTRGAFAEQRASFSGAASPSPMTSVGLLGLDPHLVSRQSTSDLGTFASYSRATDPVLTGALSGEESSAAPVGDLPSPSTQTGQFFASSTLATPQYQYDDGQTPASQLSQTPGYLLGNAPFYGAATGGFPDSTKGLAGLPPENEALSSPLERSYSATYLTFANSGDAPGLRERLHPNLHAAPAPAPPQTFAAFERKAQERRLVAGLSISQASMMYQQDLRDYQHRNQRRSSRSNAMIHDGPQQEIIQKSIR